MPRDSGVFDGGSSTTSALTFEKILVVKAISLTSAEIKIDKTGFTDTPTSYSVKIFSSTGTLLNTLSFNTDPFTVPNLQSGSTYTFSVTAYKNSNQGNTVSETYTMPTDLSSIGTLSSAPISFQATKSYLTLSATEADFKNKKYSVAFRDFPAVTVPVATEISTVNGNSYPESYFSFGTSILMDNTLDNTNQMGGYGFFVNNLAQVGYYIIIESTSSAASTDKKSVRIVKFNGNNVISLKEVGTRTESTIEGIYGGRIYNVEIKVKLNEKSVYIDAFINGYKISYVDTTTRVAGKNKTFDLTQILAPTNKVAVLCGRGKVSFDYAYAKSITKVQYNDSQINLNFYQGQFSNDLINTSFGDLAYTGNYTEDEISSIEKKETALDEFGTVVREIYKNKVRFSEPPGYPVRWSTGLNRYASIVGQKVSNFGSDIYILNNTSTTIPLANGSESSLSLYGNTLGSSGELVYKTESNNTFNTKEPVTFKSNWLQNEQDVKNLANWIKSNVVNKGKVVNMSIFGNPLISIGDIVSIKYTYQGLSGTENFIVVSVKHNYSGGLQTDIVCRAL
jgi:hypothetical protein